MNISLFGLGYVGAVTAGCLADRGHRVIGVDPQPRKVEALNKGRSPIVEPGLGELIARGREAGLISATTDAAEAIAATDLSLVCVGTPSLPSGGLDLGHVRSVAGQIKAALEAAPKAVPHKLVFRSTMLPGSTRTLAELYFPRDPALAEIFFYPEFLREGTAIRDFQEPSLTVIGRPDPSRGLDGLAEFLGPDTHVTDLESAELLKYCCNAFHATKVAFANEVGRLAKNLDIDGRQVMEFLCADNVLNISKYYMRPGNPFGGSCLPKDVSALEIFAQTRGVNLPLVESLMVSNRKHLQHLLTLVEHRHSREVVILGLAFKPDTDDLRGSAMVELASELAARGHEVRVYDPRIQPENLIGANEQLAQRKLPSLDQLLRDNLAEALGGGGTVVAFNRCVDTAEVVAGLRPGHHVIDVNGWPGLREAAASYEGLCW
jgi:GDP-mannose 6-dehydrogenase